MWRFNVIKGKLGARAFPLEQYLLDLFQRCGVLEANPEA